MPEYERIERSRLYDDIANEIEKMIREEVLKIGHLLPSEQELAQKFGVSRNILREALKTLKERGLISVRSGHRTYVERPKPETVVNAFDRFVRHSDVTLQNVFELRYGIEVMASGLAAERAESAEIEELQQIIQNMNAHQTDVEQWTQEELHFHLTIAKATKNPLFSCFIKTLASHLSVLFARGFPTPSKIRAGIGGHTAILNAVKSRAKGEAEKAMLIHLETAQKLWTEGAVGSSSRFSAESGRDGETAGCNRSGWRVPEGN